MSDLISRQAAIDIERNATVDTNPSHFEAHQKFTQFMDDAEISSFGRWQWSNGFNTALTAIGIDLRKLPAVDAVPVVRCKDCKYRIVNEHYGEEGYLNIKAICELDTGDPFELSRCAENDYWYCADGERRDND